MKMPLEPLLGHLTDTSVTASCEVGRANNYPGLIHKGFSPYGVWSVACLRQLAQFKVVNNVKNSP